MVTADSYTYEDEGINLDWGLRNGVCHSQKLAAVSGAPTQGTLDRYLLFLQIYAIF